MANKRLGDVIYNNFDQYTGKPFNTKILTHLPDGTEITDALVDNAVILKNKPEHGGGYSVRSEYLETGEVSTEWLGIDESSDITPIFSKLNQVLRDGDSIRFKKGNYKGHVNITKSVSIKGYGCSIEPTEDNIPVVSVRGSTESWINISGNPIYGDSSFTLVNASSILFDGDIIEITDEAVRPSDSTPHVNNELLKVLSIIGDTVYVEDKIRGTFNTGTVSIRKVNPNMAVKVQDINIIPSNTHTQPALWVSDGVNVIIDNVTTNNTSGNAVRLDRCYGVNTTNIYVHEPRLVGSGEGYGLAVNECRGVYSSNIQGNGTRHVVDYKCTYGFILDGVFEPNATSTGVILAHNGFGGNGVVRNIFTTGSDYSVAVIDQGFSVENQSIQVHRDYTIEKVNHTYKNRLVSDFNAAVRIQGDYSNIVIRDVTQYFENGTDFSTLSLQTNVVRLNGIAKGTLLIENIYTEFTGAIVSILSTRQDNSDVKYRKTIKNLNAKRCLNVFYGAGVGNIDLDGVNVETIDDAVARLNRSNSMNPNYIDISNKGLDYTLRSSGIKLISEEGNQSTASIKGSLPRMTSASSSGVTVNNGGIIPINRIYNSGKFLRVNFTMGSDITLDEVTPIQASQWEGHEISVVVRNAGTSLSETTGSLTIPANSDTVSNSVDLVLKPGYVYNFITYANKWNLINYLPFSADNITEGIVRRSEAVASITTANATDEATAIALVNEIKGRLNAMLQTDRNSNQRDS